MKHIISILVRCLLLSILFCSCNNDTLPESTEIQYSGETVYVSKILSLPTENPEGYEIGYFGDDWITQLPYSPTQYFSATDGDSALFFYFPDIDRYYYQPRYVTVDFSTGETEHHEMDSRVDELGWFSLNIEDSDLFHYTDEDTGEERTQYRRYYDELCNYAANASGNLAVLYSLYTRETYDPSATPEIPYADGTKGYVRPRSTETDIRYILAVYRTDGTLVYETDITEIEVLDIDPDPYLKLEKRPIIMSEDGYVGLIHENHLLFFDPNGKYLTSVDFPCGNYSIDVSIQKDADGVCYLLYRNPDTVEMEYSVINFASQTISEPIVLKTPDVYRFISFGVDHSLYYSDDLNFYRYDAEGTSEVLFNWTEMNVIGADVERVYVRDEDSFTVICHDPITGNPEVVLIDAVPIKTVTPKTDIVIAAGNYNNNSLRALQIAVSLFNRKSEDYSVTVDYYDPEGSGMFNVNQQIANDMANGKQIDLIVFHEDITMEYFDNLGILGDWYPLMDADDVYTRDAFLPCIRAAYETPDGRLPVLTTDFSLTTLVGSTALIGERDHWTYEECLDYVNSLDWDEILLQIERPDGSTEPDAMLVLRSFLPMVLDDYIDEETGTCTLDSDSFIELLNLCESVIIDHEVAAYKADDLHVEQLLYEGMGFVGEYRSGNTRLYSNGSNVSYGKGSIGHPSTILNLLVNFFKDHESLSFIGYPMPDASCGNGTAVTPMLQFGLTASAAHTDGAWEFMREYLSYMETREQSNTYENDNVYGLPCTYASLDALLDYYEGRRYLIAGGPSIQESGPIDSGSSGPFHFDADPRVRGILTELLETTTRRYSGNTAVMEIIYEEASAYYGGIRTVEETVGIMQSRVGIWLAEHVG